MRFITRDTDYATRALIFIANAAKKDTIVTVNQIVAKENLPKPLLRKILQRLTNKKILQSAKGKGGGFSLLKPAEKISLVDVIEVFQGPVNLNHCFLKNELCPNKKTCKVRKKIKQISAYINKELSNVTLASLVNPVKK